MKTLFIIALLILTVLVSGCADLSAPSKPSEKIISEDIKTEEEKPAQETVVTPPKRGGIDRAIKLNDSQIPSEKECTQDPDCVTGGCSGTICQSKNAEPIFTTCEYLPEYACYKQIQCKCIKNKCQWDKTEEFSECVEEARKSDAEVIV